MFLFPHSGSLSCLIVRKFVTCFVQTAMSSWRVTSWTLHYWNGMELDEKEWSLFPCNTVFIFPVNKRDSFDIEMHIICGTHLWSYSTVYMLSVQSLRFAKFLFYMIDTISIQKHVFEQFMFKVCIVRFSCYCFQKCFFKVQMLLVLLLKTSILRKMILWAMESSAVTMQAHISCQMINGSVKLETQIILLLKLVTRHNTEEWCVRLVHRFKNVINVLNLKQICKFKIDLFLIKGVYFTTLRYMSMSE